MNWRNCARAFKGAGNLDRFDYWLNTFKYLRALMQTRCAMGAKQPDEAESLDRGLHLPAGDREYARRPGHGGEHGEPSRLGPLVAGATGKSFPKTYAGQPRLIVPTVRSLPGKTKPSA